MGGGGRERHPDLPRRRNGKDFEWRGWKHEWEGEQEGRVLRGLLGVGSISGSGGSLEQGNLPGGYREDSSLDS